MSLTAVKNRINNIMKDYENNVRTGNSSKNKGPTSQRKRNEIWIYKIVPKPRTKLGEWTECTNVSLFDIGRNLEE